jgi:integrase
MSAAAILGYGPNRLLSPALGLAREGPPPGVPRPAGASGPRLLDQVRAAIRLRHHSRRTEKAYAGWIRRFILFHGKRHPGTMGKAELCRFLSHLAVEARASASTQYQALSALLFLYGERLVRDGKGARDRVTLLPSVAAGRPAAHLGPRALHDQDLSRGLGSVELPLALERKYPRAAFEWGWQGVSLATRHCAQPVSGRRRRHQLHESVLQEAVREAARWAGIAKPTSCHTLRHSFACRPARKRLRLPHRAEATGARGCQYDHDLHPRYQRRRPWGAEPGGSPVMGGG